VSSSPGHADPVAQLRHDLRTPVNQILGYSEMLQEDAEAAGQTATVPDLQKIQLAARNLLGLINTKLNTEGLAGLGLATTTQASAAPAREPGTATLARPASLAADPDPGRDEEPATFSGRVLAVDDNENNRDVLARRLQRHGLSVATAENGRQALERVRAEPFDLVLLDIIMPELDGYSALQQMKADPQTRHIPVIMISALDELDSVVRCIEAGAEDYLPKPFNPTLLRARIGACLEKKALRDAEQQHLRTIEETKRRLDEELAEAAHYVQSILPPPSEAPLPIDWKYQPSTELGGDAFGYHWIDPDHFAVYLLDVCGHGVGASLLSVTAINVIRSGSLPNTDFRDPGAVLSALNTAFPMERQNNMYFTLWYGVYHAPSRTLRHASGGHPPALLLTAPPAGAPADAPAPSSRLHAPGLIVGAMDGLTYESQSCPVPPGAQLFVLCDGCYEIRNAAGDVMEFSEFEQFMQAHGRQPDGLDQLQQWVRARHGDGPLDDDFSIVRIRF
jgi:sigma-B regulation protein RsbU (phosphoserine phosphatase)